MTVEKALIIANGEKLSQARIKSLANDTLIVVLDGAYQYARTLDVKIDYLLGDFDSIDSTLLTEAEQLEGLEVQHFPDQNATDLDKAIRFILKRNIQKIDIACALGQRNDHSLHNTRLLSRYAEHDLCLYTETEKLFVLKDQQQSYVLKAGDRFSLLPAPTAIVSTKGLAYDMQDYEMTYGGKDSSCNWAAAESIWVSIQGCVLVVQDEV